MNYNNYNWADDCPVCGQKDELDMYLGARRGSTSYGHSVSVCSDKCGKRYRIWLNLGKATKISDIDYEDSKYASNSKTSLRNEIKRLRNKLNKAEQAN